MYPASALCRSQEEFHRERAASTSLENVRAISAGAAAAWGLEAVAALMATRHLSASDAERQFSENPDREFATPAGA